MSFSFFRMGFLGGGQEAEESIEKEEGFEKVEVPGKSTQTRIKIDHNLPEKVDKVNVTILLHEIEQLHQKIHSQEQKIENLHQKLDLKDVNLEAQDKKIAILNNEIEEQKWELKRDEEELKRLRLQKYEAHDSLAQFLEELEGNTEKTLLMFGQDQKDSMEEEMDSLRQKISDLEAALKLEREQKAQLSPGEARERLEIENAVLQLQISEQSSEIKRLKEEIVNGKVENWNSRNPTSKFQNLNQYLNSKVSKAQIDMILEEQQIQRAQDASRNEELEERIRSLEQQIGEVKNAVS